MFIHYFWTTALQLHFSSLGLSSIHAASSWAHLHNTLTYHHSFLSPLQLNTTSFSAFLYLSFPSTFHRRCSASYILTCLMFFFTLLLLLLLFTSAPSSSSPLFRSLPTPPLPTFHISPALLLLTPPRDLDSIFVTVEHLVAAISHRQQGKNMREIFPIRPHSASSFSSSSSLISPKHK